MSHAKFTELHAVEDSGRLLNTLSKRNLNCAFNVQLHQKSMKSMKNYFLRKNLSVFPHKMLRESNLFIV